MNLANLLTDSRLGEFFWNSKIGLEIKAAAAKKRSDERREHEAAIVTLNERAERELGKLAAEKQKAKDAWLAAQLAVKRTATAYNSAATALAGTERSIENQRAKHERALAESASEDLRSALDQLGAMREQTMQRSTYEDSRKTVDAGDFHTGPVLKEVAIADNTDLIAKRMRAIREAEEAVKHAVENSAEYDLAKIVAGVPSCKLVK